MQAARKTPILAGRIRVASRSSIDLLEAGGYPSNVRPDRKFRGVRIPSAPDTHDCLTGADRYPNASSRQLKVRATQQDLQRLARTVGRPVAADLEGHRSRL